MKRSRPTFRSDLLLTIAVAAIFAMAAIGSFHGATSIDYTKTFPPSISRDLLQQVPLDDAIVQAKANGALRFIVIAAALWVMLLLLGRRERRRRFICAAGLVAPFALSPPGPFAPMFFALFAPFVTLDFLSGPDGEIVSEGWLTFAGFGWWWLLCAVLLIRSLVRRRATPGTCSSCGYDISTISSARCPECGRTTSSSERPSRTEPAA